MDAILSRKYNETGSQGAFYGLDEISLVYQCVTIELPRFVVPMRLNSPMIDCIPSGVYPVEKTISPINGLCFLIKNVPGRTKVEMHIGNFAAEKKVDTEGCILPGTRFEDLNGDGNIDVAESTVAFNKLLEILPDTFYLYIL